MCSIIGGYINTRQIDIMNFTSLVKNISLTKGGDYTSMVFFNNEEGTKGIFENIENSEDEYNRFKNFITNIIDDKEQYENLPFMVFSRLTPEMEDSTPKIFQPYKTINNKFIIAHGTIPIDAGEDFNSIIDTEIFRFDIDLEKSLEKVQELGGKVSLIEYDPTRKRFNAVHNGLGLWTYENTGIKMVTNIDLIGSTYIQPMVYNVVNGLGEEYLHNMQFYKYGSIIKKDTAFIKRKPEIIISLCSGGMDTILSTYQEIISAIGNNDILVELLYFDWGTNAAKEELEAVKRFKSYLEKSLANEKINVFINAISINVKSMFKNILDVAGLESVRIADVSSQGEGLKEAEAGISYVPFRNTYLLMLAATYAEQKYPNLKVNFVLGANLTEGMVYLDNSTNYIDKMNSLVKIAGQKTINFSVVAPYKNYTKTKMLTTFVSKFGSKLLNEILDLSFSCYFPNENGGACGTCGSCLLRNKSVERALGKHVMVKGE